MIPACKILADQQDVTDILRHRLLQLRLTDKRGMDADDLELTLAASDDLALPRQGVMLSLALGWQGQPLIDKGLFRVDAVRFRGPPDDIVISARAADFAGPLKENHNEAWHGKTLGDILTTLARRHSLQAVIDDTLAATAIPHLDQTNESDINLIRRLGEQYDAIATIKEQRLLVIPAGRGVTASGTALPTAIIDRTDTDRYDFGASDQDSTITGIKAKWRAMGAAQTVEELAGKTGNTRTLKRTFPSQGEARSAAEAAWARTRRGRHELRLSLVHGRPDLIAGQPVGITGFRPEISGIPWVACDITHTLSGDRYTTDVPCEEASEVEP